MGNTKSTNNKDTTSSDFLPHMKKPDDSQYIQTEETKDTNKYLNDKEIMDIADYIVKKVKEEKEKEQKEKDEKENAIIAEYYPIFRKYYMKRLIDNRDKIVRKNLSRNTKREFK